MNILEKFKRKIFGPQRYRQLYSSINLIQPLNIMEIGLWNGERARKMIAEATKHNPARDIKYFGFDLFESLPKEQHLHEHAKRPLSFEEIEKKLKSTGANIKLFKGNTNATLASEVATLPKMDFIYIDGGHSLETIQNDWLYSSQLMHNSTVVIFDDYWETTESGAKSIVDNIDRSLYCVSIMPIKDKSNKSERKTISFASVTKNKI